MNLSLQSLVLIQLDKENITVKNAINVGDVTKLLLKQNNTMSNKYNSTDDLREAYGKSISFNCKDGYEAFKDGYVLWLESQLIKKQYCTCRFVMVMRHKNKPYCGTCKLLVKEV